MSYLGNPPVGDPGNEEEDRPDRDPVPRGREVPGRHPHPPPTAPLDLHHPHLLLRLLDHHPSIPGYGR